jgi:hypothetical protein
MGFCEYGNGSLKESNFLLATNFSSKPISNETA